MTPLDKSELFSPADFNYDPASQTRKFDDAIHEILSCEFSFDSLNLLYQYLDEVSTLFQHLTDFPLECGPLSKMDRRWIARLEKTMVVVAKRTVAAKKSLPLRLHLEESLAALLARVTQSPIDLNDNADVLCGYFHGYFRVAGLRFYLQSRTVHTSGSWRVAKIPHWLHVALTNPQGGSLTVASLDPEWELANILHIDAKEMIFPSCAPVPSANVFADALTLWSDDALNMYHDIAKAIDAVTRLN